MSAKDEERFQSSNKCWMWKHLFDVVDNKVKYHDHATENIEILFIGVVVFISF